MWSIPFEIQERHLDLFLSMSDGFINAVSPETIRPYVSPDLTDQELVQYCQQVKNPSNYPAIREFIHRALKNSSSDSSQLFYVLMTVLSNRSLAFALTRSTKLVSEMTAAEKRQLFLSWRQSPIEAKNKIFTLFSRLTLSAFTVRAPDLHYKAMDFPQVERREQIYDNYKSTQIEYQMQEPPAHDNSELFIPHVDVVIIGSGSGAGVAAHTLARDGHKVLVLEKGKYFSPSELVFDDEAGLRNLYEQGGMITTENSQTLLLAGSTFGGGSTVNWSACLKPPFKVRQEWYTDHGLEFAATEDYDNCLDYVLQQMGASTDHIQHSVSNQVILDGAAKLGYKHKEIPQNTGGHEHSCGFCHLGCKWGIKQGSMDLWLKDAAAHGAQFMDQVLVEKILRNNDNIAIGLQCLNERNGKRFTIKGAKKYVLSGGSFNTPILLQKSGFKNKHIGRNLKLHPMTTFFAVWDTPKTDPFDHSIMTALCSEVEDMDGRAHGCKIETLVHSPVIEAAFLPWESSDQIRQDLLKYQRTSAYIVLTRDTSSGSVTYDKHKKGALKVDYVINKFDRECMNKAILIAMDMAYIEGAVELIHPHWRAGRFQSSKPKHDRNISDADYQKYRRRCAETSLASYGAGYGSAHQMSSCRMSGKGPKDGVCDVRGRPYECDNVYVADASVMPTASGANPMITTMAFARHVAQGICRDLSKPKI